MSRIFSNSSIIPGIIEEVEIWKVRTSAHNYRYPMRGIYDLTNSIKEKGLLQPILVRTKEDFFEIVSGDRRYFACKDLGWRKIVCHILELDDKAAFEVSLVENIQRKNLDPVEEGQAFKDYVLNFGWGGISDLATKIGKSISYIDKRIRILDLPSDVLYSISDSTISSSIAEELLSLRDSHTQSKIARLVLREGLSTRMVRGLIKDHQQDSTYRIDEISRTVQMQHVGSSKQAHRAFDKSIISLRIAINRLGTIIQDVEDNWIIYEVLMQHRKSLHAQIDLLIKEKKKMAKAFAYIVPLVSLILEWCQTLLMD